MGDEMKEIQGPYIAWYQADTRRELVEITSAPKCHINLPYLENWRKPVWTVTGVHPAPAPNDSAFACNGEERFLVSFLRPMNADTRALLAIREGKPVSPFITPEVPEIVFPDAAEEMQKAKMDAFGESIYNLNKIFPALGATNVPVRKESP
jgi:hypothetical protein